MWLPDSCCEGEITTEVCKLSRRIGGFKEHRARHNASLSLRRPLSQNEVFLLVWCLQSKG
jgi:hypothetical protein